MRTTSTQKKPWFVQVLHRMDGRLAGRNRHIGVRSDELGMANPRRGDSTGTGGHGARRWNGSHSCAERSARRPRRHGWLSISPIGNVESIFPDHDQKPIPATEMTQA